MKDARRFFRGIMPFLLVDGLFFGLIAPNPSDSLIILIACGLMAVTTYMIVSQTLQLARWDGQDITAATRRRFAAFTTILVLFMALMSSIGQLGSRDMLAAVPLLTGAYIYMSYAHSKGLVAQRPTHKNKT